MEARRSRSPRGRHGKPASPRRSSRIGLALFFAVLLLIVAGGMFASYSFSRSAENESAVVINSYDLRGDLGTIAGDLNLLKLHRSIATENELDRTISEAQVEISELNAVDYHETLLERAVRESDIYLADADRQSTLLLNRASIATVGPEPKVLSSTAVADLIDRAASRAERSAESAANIGRVGGIGSLLVVVVFIGAVLSWRSRRDQKLAVTFAQAEERAQYEAIIENSSDLFFLTGADSQVQYCSPSAARFFGMPAAEVCRTPLIDLVHPDDLQRTGDAFSEVMAAGVAGPFDMRIRHHDGGWRTLEVTANDLSLSSSVQATAWHSRDVTDRRELEDQLARQAFEDPLTGLANRALFRDRLSHALARLSRSKRSIAVLMIDLDGFKAINDSMGHDAGDEALKEIAARLTRSARPGDTVARLGGDEFTVLLEGLTDPGFVDEIADRILDIVRQPLVIENVSLRVSASIGISIASSASLSPESLLRDADIAMYSAKADGRDRRAHFRPEMHTRANKQLQISQDLAHALDRNELVIHYQPSVSLDGERPEGVEALVRWNHRNLGLILPDSFIPIAEQNGLIVPIGRWVLEQACEQAVAWKSDLLTGDIFTMSVNVSGRQLNHESLIPDVRSILRSSGLDPASLILEITESALLHDMDLVIERLRSLKELGVSIAIDDFGTGYSSLSYLQKLPIDILKIDKAFVDASTNGDPGGDAIIQAIIDLCEGLHLKTIAEGIEQPSQADHIRELGCQSAQGYLFSRPMPPEELWSFFAQKALERHPDVVSK